MVRVALAAVLAAALVSATTPSVGARQEPPRGKVSVEELQTAIGRLGSLEFPVRMNAARTVRRAAPGNAVPALIEAVGNHADGYIRFRALVLLAGFNDPLARDVMVQAMTDPNDRLRTVAYAYFEHHPESHIIPQLLQALDREVSEFVRPALTRALAAAGSDARVRKALVEQVGRGQDFFRAAVIEALGDYRADYAVAAILDVASREGPLQDDAALALGKIGDKRALAALSGMQRSAPRNVQPIVATAICLLGVNCGSHQGYVTETLKFAIANSGFQELLRNASMGMAAIATAGKQDAFDTLLDQGIPTRDPARAPIALAAGTVAIRNTRLTLSWLQNRSDLDASIELLREAFDMLEEDFEEERFFATVRRTYWEAKEDSALRRVAGVLIQKLEF